MIFSVMLEVEHPNDLKKASLALFGKTVSLTLNDPDLIAIHGKTLTGRLSGRVWGDRIEKTGERTETVIAITIAINEVDELTIPCKSILALEEFKG